MNKAYYQKDRILIPTIDAQYTYGYGTSLSGPKVSAILDLIIEKFNLKNSPYSVENILYENILKKNMNSRETIQILDISNFIK